VGARGAGSGLARFSRLLTLIHEGFPRHSPASETSPGVAQVTQSRYRFRQGRTGVSRTAHCPQLTGQFTVIHASFSRHSPLAECPSSPGVAQSITPCIGVRACMHACVRACERVSEGRGDVEDGDGVWQRR